MFNNWPYTNLNELNLDWILQQVKDIQDKYTDLDSAIAAGVEAVQQQEETSLQDLDNMKLTIVTAINGARDIALVDVNATKTNAINDITTAQGAAESAIAADKTNAQAAIETDKTNALTAIAALGNTWDDHYESLIAEMPADLASIVQTLAILGRVLTGESEQTVTFFMGDYAGGSKTTPTPAATSDVSTNMIIGGAGFKFVFTLDDNVDANTKIYAIRWFEGKNASTGVYTDEHIVSCGNVRTYTWTVPDTCYGFSITLRNSVTSFTSAPASDIATLRWNTTFSDFVSVDTDQDYTDEQKAQGRENIGAASEEDYAELESELNELKSAIGDDFDTCTVTVNPTTASVQGYAYFSPVQTGSTVQFSTNSGHSYNIYTNLNVGESYHFKTYANTTFGNHIVFANSSNKVTGFAIGQQSTAGSVETDYTIPTDTTTVYVICNKGTADTASSVAVTKVAIIPLTTDFQAVKEDVGELLTDVGAITAATAEDVGKALSPKTVADGKVTEWEFKTLGGGLHTENRYVAVVPVANSAANGRTNATVGSTVAFGSQTDWYHVKFEAEPGDYRATYYSSNSSKYNNIVAVNSSEKVLAILNDTPSGSGVITKDFTAPANTAYIYLCNYGVVGRSDSVLLLEKKVALTDTDRLDNVEKQTTASTFNITNDTVAGYFNNVTYTDGDYTTSEVNNYRINPGYSQRADIPNPVVIRWNPVNNAVRITAIVSEGTNLTYARYRAYECDPSSGAKAIYNLEPNKTYYYQVIATLESGIDAILAKGQFTTANSIVRMLYIDGIQNVRDIGGIAAGSSTVAYGKIIRGSELDAAGFSSSTALTTTNGYSKITDAGRDELVNHVGIRAELDLRANGTAQLLPSIDYQDVAFPFYDEVLSGSGLTALGTAFTFVKNKVTASRPVYIHCQGGNDRTGTLITCLIGLLGASENSISKEYEMSSFVFGESRLRNSTSYKFGALMLGVLALTGDTLADKFATLFTSAGASSSDISSFRNAMLVT